MLFRAEIRKGQILVRFNAGHSRGSPDRAKESRGRRLNVRRYLSARIPARIKKSCPER